jgi:hypothetical protein
MGGKLADVMSNAAYYFKLSAPDWCPQFLQQTFIAEMHAYGLPQVYLPGDYLPLGWSVDVAALLLGVVFYLVALMVIGYGLAVWYSGMTLNFAVLAYKKDEKNVLELPDDDEDLIEPVPTDEKKDLAPKPANEQPAKED